MTWLIEGFLDVVISLLSSKVKEVKKKLFSLNISLWKRKVTMYWSTFFIIDGSTALEHATTEQKMSFCFSFLSWKYFLFVLSICLRMMSCLMLSNNGLEKNIVCCASFGCLYFFLAFPILHSVTFHLISDPRLWTLELSVTSLFQCH